MSDPDRLDAARVQHHLRDCATPWRVEVREACGSSNSELMTAAQSGAAHASVLVCERQSAGRGRRGRRWESSAAGSLTFSFLWRRAADAPPPTGLSLAVGLALAHALEACGCNEARLKWPNDVVAGGGKLAGILVELVTGPGAATDAAVVGIGINLALPPGFAVAGALPARDLAGLMAEVPSRNRLLEAILRAADLALRRFDVDGFAALQDDWMQRHAYTGAQVRLITEHGPPIDGRCVGVDAEGALWLDTVTGPQRVLAGDVSLRADP